MVFGAWLVTPCTACPHSSLQAANTPVRPYRSPLSTEGDPEQCHGRPDRSRKKFAKNMLGIRPEADHCHEASRADEKGSRSRRHEDIHEIRCQSRQIDFLAQPHIPLRAAVPQCLPLAAAGAAPGHFPSTSVRSALLRSAVLPWSRNPATSEAVRSWRASSFLRCASTQAPSRISRRVRSRRACSALFEPLHAIMTPPCPGSLRNPSRAFTLPSPTLLERCEANHFRMSGNSLECQIDKLEIPLCRKTPAHGRPGKKCVRGTTDRLGRRPLPRRLQALPGTLRQSRSGAPWHRHRRPLPSSLRQKRSLPLSE